MVKVRLEDLDCAKTEAICWTLLVSATVAEIKTADLLRLGLSTTRPNPKNRPKLPDQSLVSVGHGLPAEGPKAIDSSCGLVV